VSPDWWRFPAGRKSSAYEAPWPGRAAAGPEPTARASVAWGTVGARPRPGAPDHRPSRRTARRDSL